jgi:hypothetical protein
MSRQIIKQPNGKYAVFSSNTNSFIIENCTREELEIFYIEEEKAKIKNILDIIIGKLDAGIKPYYQFTMTYEEAKNTIKEKQYASNTKHRRITNGRYSSRYF